MPDEEHTFPIQLNWLTHYKRKDGLVIELSHSWKDEEGNIQKYYKITQPNCPPLFMCPCCAKPIASLWAATCLANNMFPLVIEVQ